LRRLFDAHPSLTEPDVRRQSVLLGRSLVVVMLLFVFVDGALDATSPDYTPPWAGYGILIGTIALNRAGYFRAASILATSLFSIVAFVLVYTGSVVTPSLTLSYLALGPMLGTFFLPIRGVVALTLLNLLGIVLVGLVTPSLHGHTAVLIGPFSTTAMLGALAAFYMHHRNTIEADRRAELQRSEEQLRKAQKLEALGRLAGGIAHDFNNVLMVILGNSGVLRYRGQASQELDRIEAAATSAATLTRQLLAFGRGAVLEPTVLDLEKVVRGTTAMVARLIGEDITIACRIDAPPWPTRLDQSLIEQVILNLATNARDAMPEGGTLEISIENVTLAPGDPRLGKAHAPGDYVRLSVRDDGEGMDEATQQHVFEPFFTTKPRGKGTGLGLAMVFGTVSQSGGFLELASAKGQGARFDLYFPRTSDVAEPQDKPPAKAATGRETLLLVEDDDSVRTVVELILREAGYRVLAAGSASEARTLWPRHGQDVDLVITDEIMPGGRGTELIAELRRERPSLRALSMSGYAEPESVAAADSMEIARIQKPFAPDDLLRQVRSLLDG
jgi:signal transduction histidine kinase/CheY-like chemotaxis protein